MLLYCCMCVIISLAVFGICLVQNRIYRVPKWKLLICVAGMIASGAFGVYFLSYVERGYWGGMSFFGCIFLSTPVMLIISKVLKLATDKVMDICGPVCATFLVLSKVNCKLQGCCFGYLRGYAEDGTCIRFPSAIVEGINGLVIGVLLLLMQRNPKNRGCIAPAFLLMFGVTRFILNFFRHGLTTFRIFYGTDVFLPSGHLWAAICIIWGIIWMYRARSRVYGRKLSAKEFITSIFGLLPLKECA